MWTSEVPCVPYLKHLWEAGAVAHTCYHGTGVGGWNRPVLSFQPAWTRVNFQASKTLSNKTKQSDKTIWPVTELNGNPHRRGDPIRPPWCCNNQLRNEGYPWKCSGNYCSEFFRSPQRHPGKDLVFREIGSWSQSQPVCNPSMCVTQARESRRGQLIYCWGVCWCI